MTSSRTETADGQRRDGKALASAAVPIDAARALVSAIDHAAHLLPTQAPIETFIHHNTLHAYENWSNALVAPPSTPYTMESSLPFHEAVAAAHEAYGAIGYLGEAEYRAAYARGRISDRDVRAAVSWRFGNRLRQVGEDDDAFSDEVAVLRAAMLHDCDPRPLPNVRWTLHEDNWPADLAEHELWRACVDAIGRCEPRSELAIGTTPESFAASLGVRSHRDLVRALSGRDLGVDVDPVVIRACAAHLDEGIALDNRPGRGAGLWTAWRRCQRPGRRALDGLAPDMQLAEDPTAACCRILTALGVPTDRWNDYVRRVLLHIPGWAGMVRWREMHPEYGEGRTHPTALVDYLAVFLTCELAAVHRACAQELDGLEPIHIHDHWRVAPDELAVRVALFAGELDDALAARAHEVLAAPGKTKAPGCAAIVLEHRNTRGDSTLVRAWQLMRAAQALGVSAYQLTTAASSRVTKLLTALDAVPPAQRLPIWQEAYEAHYRNDVLEAMADLRRHRPPPHEASFQVAFCFDDREEGFRRHLEEAAPACVTFGAPGFFGIPIAFRGRTDESFSPLCPLGVNPAKRVIEVASRDSHRRAKRFDAMHSWIDSWRSHWHESLHHGIGGLLATYAAGLVAWLRLIGFVFFPRYSAALRGPVTRMFLPPHATEFVAELAEHDGDNDTIAGFTLQEQIDRVTALLQNIGLVNGFARLIALVGHGSSSVNNPHLSAYDCGACRGRHGGPNARLGAAMANSRKVRTALRERGIDIPDDTWFIGGEHNTCNEDVLWSDLDGVPPSHREILATMSAAFDRAREMSAHERCRRLEHAPPGASPRMALRHVQARSVDPSQPRPELGHATNAFAVIGRRNLTRGLFFDRRGFIISYDPTIDATGSILERIMMAVTPVGAGISLEYYFSRCDLQRYGAGTKLPHNVVGLIGVMDGTCSDLRTGLPRQMVEIHEPMRLLAVIESTPEILGGILARQPMLREIVGNGWVTVVAIDPESGEAALYRPGIGFRPWVSRGVELPVMSSSAAWYAGQTDFLPPVRIGWRTP